MNWNDDSFFKEMISFLNFLYLNKNKVDESISFSKDVQFSILYKGKTSNKTQIRFAKNFKYYTRNRLIISYFGINEDTRRDYFEIAYNYHNRSAKGYYHSFHNLNDFYQLWNKLNKSKSFNFINPYKSKIISLMEEIKFNLI